MKSLLSVFGRKASPAGAKSKANEQPPEAVEEEPEVPAEPSVESQPEPSGFAFGGSEVVSEPSNESHDAGSPDDDFQSFLKQF